MPVVQDAAPTPALDKNRPAGGAKRAAAARVILLAGQRYTGRLRVRKFRIN